MTARSGALPSPAGQGLAGNSRLLLALAAALGVGVVALALFTQHVLDMLPCPWCILQRVQFLAIAVAAAAGAMAPPRWPRRAAAAVVVLLAASGVATALWQHFVAAASASCNLTLADRIVSALGLDGALPSVFAAYASCADAAVRLLGVPYEFYSLAVFVLLAALAVQAWRRS